MYLALPPYFFSFISLLPALAQADKRGKKERFVVLNKTAHLKMLPELYLNCLNSQLNASQLLTLEMLVWLLQFHKQVRVERLAVCLPLPILYLIALAYTCAGLRGQAIKASGEQKYIGRLKELKRMTRRHSNFWVGLYGQMWIAALEACSDWVKNLMMIRPNKRTFFQKGLRAMALIEADF